MEVNKMKKVLVFLIACILMSTIVFAASVSRDIPSRISPGEEVKVELRISSISLSDVVKTFAVEESLPTGFELSDWSITGVEESKSDVKTDFSGNNHKFEFTPTGVVTISYSTTAPSGEGSYDFKATWFDLSGMSGANDGKSKVTVRTITCGDSICEGSENEGNCEADCKKAAAPEPEVVEEEEPKQPGLDVVGLIVILAIVIIGLVIYFSVTKKKSGSKSQEEEKKE